MYLCWNRGRTVTAEEISVFYGISRDHVVKVIQELSRQGYVQARRGRGGGSVLAREPKSIPVGEIISTFEGPPALLECLRSDHVCVIERGCRLRGVLAEAQLRMMQYLDSVTLDDIAGSDAPEMIELTSKLSVETHPEGTNNVPAGPATSSEREVC